MFIIDTTIQDIDTGELLPFASVVITDRNGKSVPVNGVNPVGRKADTDGRVIIPIANENDYITVSYVGYESISHPADDYRNDIIYLKKKAVKYGGKEIVIKGKKPKPQPNERNNPAPKPAPPKKIKKTPWLLIAGIAALAVTIGGLIIYKIRKK